MLVALFGGRGDRQIKKDTAAGVLKRPNHCKNSI